VHTPTKYATLAPVALHEDEVAVDEAVVRALLRAQRPDLADMELSHVGGGTDNTMYRIGADHVARLPRTPQNVAPLRKELTWLPRLAPHLTHRIPTPVHAGRPSPYYPLHWAIFTWIEGEELSARAVTDWTRYGQDLAGFVASLHSTDLMGATPTGDLSWYRGGPLHPLDEHVTSCFTDARSRGLDLDLDRLQHLWRQALRLPQPSGPLVWLHGDLRPANVLTHLGRLHAVLDFGALSIGHPDAEHAVAWDLPALARRAYRASLGIDEFTWARARAWAIALSIDVAEYWDSLPSLVAEGLHRLAAITEDDTK
jgi:aminoglycoside phosphotransferase (APT) family kinase protein